MTGPAALRALVEEALEQGGVAAPQAEARWIVEAVTGRRRPELSAHAQPVDPELVDAAVAMARRRAAGEPLQYITGTAAFRQLELAVGPGVLIPRPETEVVAEAALSHLPPRGIAVDVGTGSGALALSIAFERPDVRVFATDASAEALAWAAKNRDALALDVDLIACDLLAGLPGEIRGRVDVVVSNPPYVAENERATLPVDVVAHEPHRALFGGRDGLQVIGRVIEQAMGWLRHDGWLVLEIAPDQGERVGGMLRDRGYRDVSVDRDLAGRERVVAGRR